MFLGRNITFVIPFRDDEDSIAEAVQMLNNAAKSLFDDYEILAMGLNSTDNSFALVSLLKRSIPNLRLVVTGSNDLLKEAKRNSTSSKICQLNGPKELRKVELVNLLREVEQRSKKRGLHIGKDFTFCDNDKHAHHFPLLQNHDKDTPFLSKVSTVIRRLANIEVDSVS